MDRFLLSRFLFQNVVFGNLRYSICTSVSPNFGIHNDIKCHMIVKLLNRQSRRHVNRYMNGFECKSIVYVNSYMQNFCRSLKFANLLL